MSATYVNQHIYLSANGARVGDIDCSDFIKDGMLSSVELCSNQLIFIFNAESGKTAISVALSNFIDETNYYKKTETSSASEISAACKLDAYVVPSDWTVEYTPDYDEETNGFETFEGWWTLANWESWYNEYVGQYTG